MSTIAIGNERGLERFDCVSGRWSEVESTNSAGAYRFDHSGMTYAFRGADGVATSGPHEIVKLKAARHSGVHLHYYDHNRMAFLSALGAEPPGLLARALVACSGDLPTIEGRTSVYGSVPPSIAAVILHILYERPIS
ncbi:MAG: hypothetical protein EOP84_17840 [Verrucomicrobiaceae bacterium]|nr:MAG: hypothetical protein EOP84_17840 [Verrucomicrobiaceae bacterium]